MFKTGCGEILLKLVCCSTLECRSCPMGQLLLAGSGPRTLHSVLLLAKEPLQGHIILPLHLKFVSSHQMTRREREKGAQCPASSAQACVENCICSWALKCLLKTRLCDVNTLCSPWYVFHSETTPSPESCYCQPEQNIFFPLANLHGASQAADTSVHMTQQFSNCLKINLYKYRKKLKESKEHRLSHSSAT